MEANVVPGLVLRAEENVITRIQAPSETEALGLGGDCLSTADEVGGTCVRNTILRSYIGLTGQAAVRKRGEILGRDQAEREPYYVTRLIRAGIRITLDLNGILERLSLSLARVLRRVDDEESVEELLRKGEASLLSHREYVSKIDRYNAGIGITGGGDCAGIADCLAALRENLSPRIHMLGVRNAGKGLAVDPESFLDQLIVLDSKLLAKDLRSQSSAPFGGSRFKPLKKSAPADSRENALNNLRDFRFVYGTGGNGHMRVLSKIAAEFPEKVVVGACKSIDDDVTVNGEHVQCLGFNSAVKYYRTAIANVAANANAHGQINLVKVFGHHSGKLAFESARIDDHDFSGLDSETARKIQDCGQHVMIFVPERPVNLRAMVKVVIERYRKTGACVPVVAEGFMPPELKCELLRLYKNKYLKGLWKQKQFNPVTLPGWIETDGPSDPRQDLKKLLENQVLAAQFCQNAWGTDDGDFEMIPDMTDFLIEAIKVMGANEMGRCVDVKFITETHEGRGAAPSQYDQEMARKCGKKMAELVEAGVPGGYAVVYLAGMDPYQEEPKVKKLKNITNHNNLNNDKRYPQRILRSGGVYCEEVQAAA